jgi:hypothetical protein
VAASGRAAYRVGNGFQRLLARALVLLLLVSQIGAATAAATDLHRLGANDPHHVRAVLTSGDHAADGDDSGTLPVPVGLGSGDASADEACNHGCHAAAHLLGAPTEHRLSACPCRAVVEVGAATHRPTRFLSPPHRPPRPGV